MLEQPLLDQFLGVGVDGHVVARPFHLADELDQLPRVVDAPIDQAAGQADHFRIGLGWQLQVQGHLLAIQHVDECLAIAVGFRPRGRGKAPPHAVQQVQDMLAGAQRVGAEVGTGAVRLPPLLSTQGHAVGLARQGAGHRVVGPGSGGVGRGDAELLALGPLVSFAEGVFHQLALAQEFQGPVLVGRGSQSQRGLLLQHQRHGGPHVPADRFAGRAVELQPVAGGGHGGDAGHDVLAAGGLGKLHAEQIAAEIDVALDVDVEVRPLADQLGPARSQELAGPHVGQPREPVSAV